MTPDGGQATDRQHDRGEQRRVPAPGLARQHAAEAHVSQFASFYYNFAEAHGYSGVIDFKDYSLNWKAGTRDFERGQLDHILADHWQTDTSISNGSWGYIEHDTFKSPEFLVHQLVDIVSKNGNLLLNFGPKSDGTIPDEIRNTLLEMGAWLKVNGDAIYDTTPWTTFGEGPTQVKGGAFHDTDTKPYTSDDFRFTAKGTTVYAIGMACPADRKATIHSLGWAHEGRSIPIGSVKLLGITGRSVLDARRGRAQCDAASQCDLQICVCAEADACDEVSDRLQGPEPRRIRV